MAAASAFRGDLNEKSEKAKSKGGKGSPLANVDPVAFQIYLKLALLNKWSVEHLKTLKLHPNTLLSLLAICRRFGISEAIKNLEAQAEEFIRSFHHFKHTKTILEMSQSNLTTIVSSEDLQMTEMDIFECVCRWAEFQCTQKGIEKNGENMRTVLSSVLFEIRFPKMSKNQFSEVCRLQMNLLNQLEVLAIRSLIGMDDEEKQEYDGSQLPFKTHARKQQKPITKFYGETLYLTRNRNIVDIPPFVFDGKQIDNNFKITSGRIALHGIGFLGPIDEDSYFDVIVRIKRRVNHSTAYDSGKKKKRIFARRRETFHFVFDEPITIEQTDEKSTLIKTDHYTVWFWLKGPNTMAVKRNYGDQEALEQNGVEFRFHWWKGCSQVEEFLYKKL